MELDHHFSHKHKLIFNEKNNLDPDEGISSICFICGLPIFYTPYYSCSTIGCDDFFIHQRCAHLPKRLKHISGVDLTAKIGLDHMSSPSCIKCHRNCSLVAWKSVVRKWNASLLSQSRSIYPYVGFSERAELKTEIFDAICAAFLELRIFHGSHEHELIPMNTEEFTICDACGLRHENERGRLSTFYCCFWCKLRLHENCATLPSYIQRGEHEDHPLALTYALPRDDETSYCCQICRGNITSLGIYFCGKCSYYAHVKCATRYSKDYKHVPSCEIQIRDQSNNYWIHFPMDDEETSLVSHILENMKFENHASSSSAGSDKHHDHPLIFNATSANPGRALICDGCVQPISSPYYSCSRCTDYLLHESCANLPPSIVHSTHEHPLSLKIHKGKSGFYCRGCRLGCNGFSYSCSKCRDFQLDVQCAFLPKLILHKAHDKRHVLRFICEYYEEAKCCDEKQPIGFRYICTGFCCDFQIHASCAGLPMFARHKFDKHPLKLIMGRTSITSDHQDEINFCEFCEEEIDSKYWYYDCAECHNSFHVKCIPALGETSKIKLRAGLKSRVHPHRLTTIRLLTTVSRKSRCGDCKNEISNFEDKLAFECSKCDLTFHDTCAFKGTLAFRIMRRDRYHGNL